MDCPRPLLRHFAGIAGDARNRGLWPSALPHASRDLNALSLKYLRAPGCHGIPARFEVCHSGSMLRASLCPRVALQLRSSSVNLVEQGSRFGRHVGGEAKQFHPKRSCSRPAGTETATTASNAARRAGRAGRRLPSVVDCGRRPRTALAFLSVQAPACPCIRPRAGSGQRTRAVAVTAPC